MRIDVDSNAGEVARSLRFLFRDQVPFAVVSRYLCKRG